MEQEALKLMLFKLSDEDAACGNDCEEVLNLQRRDSCHSNIAGESETEGRVVTRLGQKSR